MIQFRLCGPHSEERAEHSEIMGLKTIHPATVPAGPNLAIAKQYKLPMEGYVDYGRNLRWLKRSRHQIAKHRRDGA